MYRANSLATVHVSVGTIIHQRSREFILTRTDLTRDSTNVSINHAQFFFFFTFKAIISFMGGNVGRSDGLSVHNYGHP